MVDLKQFPAGQLLVVGSDDRNEAFSLSDAWNGRLKLENKTSNIPNRAMSCQKVSQI